MQVVVYHDFNQTMFKAFFMGNLKLIVSAVLILAITFTALAFRAHSRFGAGSVYCAALCPNAARVSFRVNPTGIVVAPCGVGVQPYVLVGVGVCPAVGFGNTFSAVAAGN